MKQIVCAVYDRAAELYGRPFYVSAPGQAVRSFSDEVNRADGDRGDMAKHPDDFDLYQLAVFNDNSGEFVPGVVILARGKDVVTKGVDNV